MKHFLKPFLYPICAVMMLCLSVGVACALPTTVPSTITSDPYVNGQTPAAGFYLYWCAQTSATACTDATGNPVGYTNANRADLGLPTNVVTTGLNISIKTVDPSASSGMCFRATAYDAIKNESIFSNERCGYLGGINPVSNEALK